MLADRLGFHDAFVGEHLTDPEENITSSLIFLATLVSETKTIKLATGTSNLSHSHPVLIAAHAAMFDHLAQGRFIFGVSPGALSSDAEALGILEEDRNRLFAEAIDVILAIWERNAPYDIDFPGNRFKVSTARTQVPEVGRGTMYKPYQKPRPEIVGTVVAPHSKGVIAMGERDFHPLSANFLLAAMAAEPLGRTTPRARKRPDTTPNPAEWRIARTIFVADDARTARRYGRDDPASPYRFYWEHAARQHDAREAPRDFQAPRERGRRRGDPRRLLDELVIWGTPDKVADEILRLREGAGPFGEIVYAGMDWVDPGLARRSMELMANEVMPRIDRALAETV